MFKELYPASMNDIQMWNIRELRLCLEWAKTFEEFQRLSDNDQVQFIEKICLKNCLQFVLVRFFAFTYNILNRFVLPFINIICSFRAECSIHWIMDLTRLCTQMEHIFFDNHRKASKFRDVSIL